MSDHVHQYAEDVQREAYNERAIVLSWLAKPEAYNATVTAIAAHCGGSPGCDRMSATADAVLAALRQLVEEGK